MASQPSHLPRDERIRAREGTVTAGTTAASRRGSAQGTAPTAAACPPKAPSRGQMQAAAGNSATRAGHPWVPSTLGKRESSMVTSSGTLGMHRRGLKQHHPGGATLEPPSTQPPTHAAPAPCLCHRLGPSRRHPAASGVGCKLVRMRRPKHACSKGLFATLWVLDESSRPCAPTTATPTLTGTSPSFIPQISFKNLVGTKKACLELLGILSQAQ